jgi:hypothetical protein
MELIVAEDDLTAMGRAESIGHLDQKLERSHAILVQHIDAHRRWMTVVLGLAGLVGAGLAWGGSLFRDAITADARDKCGETTRQQVAEARAEHGELRAADQRLAEKQAAVDRELQKLAMWRLEQRRGVKPK